MKTYAAFFLITISQFCGPLLYACGWYPMPEEVRVSIFGSGLMPQAGYEPFFYSRHFLYNYDGSKTQDLFWKANLKEWESCFGHVVKQTEIDHFLSDLPYKLFDQASSYVFEKEDFRMTELYRVSPVARYLIDTDENEILAYFFFAKAAERLVNPSGQKDSWRGISYDLPAIRSLIAEIQATYKRVEDPLLKMRYAYQVVMLSRYIGDNEACVRVYDEQLDPQPQSSQIRWLALLHKATALARLNRLDEANLAFAHVFENSPGRRARAYMGFDVQHADSMDISALSEKEKGLILVMRALKNPGPALELIKEVNKYLGNHPLLNLLLIREVNKLEEWVLTPRFTGYAMSKVHEPYHVRHSIATQAELIDFFAKNREKDLAYARQVQKWATTFVKSQKGKARWTSLLANAHLALIQQDYPESQKWLAEAKIEDLSTPFANQADLTELLAFVRNPRESDQQLFQRLFPLLQNLENRIQYEQNLRNNPWFVSEESKLFGHVLLGLSYRMEAEGKKDLAAILMAKVKPTLKENKWASHVNYFRSPASNYGFAIYPLMANYNHYLYLEENADIATVEKLLAWTQKTNKEPWEIYFLSNIEKTKNRLIFSLGRMHMRKYQVEKALKVMSRADTAFWRDNIYQHYFNGDPFQSPLQVRAGNSPKVALNPVELLEKLSQINRKTALKADDLEKLGNAYYNMSYYGSYWVMFRSWQSAIEMRDYPISGNTQFAADYYGCAKAKSYFEQALNQSQDSQQQARILLMLAACAEKHHAWQNRDLKRQERQLPIGLNPYYKRIKRDFQSEKAYILSRCEQLKYFL